MFSYIRKQITAEKMVYISGNHDNIVKLHKLMPTVDYYQPDYRVWIEHGHRLDYANSTCSCLGQCISCLIGYCERYVHHDIDQELSRMFFVPRFERNVYEKDALEFADQKEVDVVIYGHTHDGYSKQLSNNIWYGNSGTWTQQYNTCQGVYLNIGYNISLEFRKDIALG